MQSIKDLINQLKWDKNLNPADYYLYYLDRISKQLKEIRFTDIKRIEGNTIILEKHAEEIEIPMHRIKRVKKNNKTAWLRE